MNKLTRNVSSKVEYEMNRCGVSWFKFDEPSGNVTDSKGSAVGTINGGVTRVAGWNGEGNALSFNGTNGHVNFNQRVIPLGKKSIRFKIKRQPISELPLSEELIIGNDGVSSENFGMRVMLDGRNVSNPVLYFNGSKGTSRVFNFSVTVNANLVCDNQWHDVLFTWDGTTNPDGVKLYVDDMDTKKSMSFATSTETMLSSFNLAMGSTNGSTSNRYYFNGQIDNLEIYNDAIDPHFNKFLISSNEKYYSYTDLYTNMNRCGVGWFIFDEPSGNVTDSKGNTVGTISGGVTRVTGWNGQGNALSFNGTSGYVQFDQKVIPIGKKSIRFKVKCLNASNVVARIIGTTNGNSNGSVISISMGRLQFHVKDNMAGVSYNSTKLINDGIWHDILLTWDGTTNPNGLKFYIDDMVTPESLFTTHIASEASHGYNAVIGKDVASSVLFLNGQLDNIEIYNDVIFPNTKLTVLDSSTVQNFIDYGLENGSEISFDTKINEIQYIKDSSSTLGTGKLFNQIFFTSKTPIKKVSIE